MQQCEFLYFKEKRPKYSCFAMDFFKKNYEENVKIITHKFYKKNNIL